MSNHSTTIEGFDMVQNKSKYVAYLRVSTDRQGRSGLGLEAQRESVRRFVSDRSGIIIAPEFVEVESGKRNDRPELAKALKRCQLTGATLVVSKLDRLSRNAAFLLTLRDSGVDFVAADLPEANTLTIGVMASMAQHEREIISARTKAALAASKKALGGYRERAPDIKKYQKAGVAAIKANADKAAEDRREVVGDYWRSLGTYNAVAARLNDDGIETPRKGRWTATAVKRLLARL